VKKVKKSEMVAEGDRSFKDLSNVHDRCRRILSILVPFLCSKPLITLHYNLFGLNSVKKFFSDWWRQTLWSLWEQILHPFTF